MNANQAVSVCGLTSEVARAFCGHEAGRGWLLWSSDVCKQKGDWACSRHPQPYPCFRVVIPIQGKLSSRAALLLCSGGGKARAPPQPAARLTAMSACCCARAAAAWAPRCCTSPPGWATAGRWPRCWARARVRTCGCAQAVDLGAASIGKCIWCCAAAARCHCRR